MSATWTPMLSTTPIIFCGLQDELCDTIQSLPKDVASPCLIKGLMDAHCKLSDYYNTVPFRSIRQAPWPMTALPKFWFWQDAEMAVTACFFWHIGKIFEDFCRIYVEIVHLNWFHSNREKCPLDCSGKFFSIFMQFIYDFFNGFGSWPKLPWPLWLFGIWKWPMTCDCWIDWNGTVHLMSHLFISGHHVCWASVHH